MLYDSTKDASLGKWNGYLNPYGSSEGELKTSRSRFVMSAASMNQIRTLSAQRIRDSQTLYANLLTVQWDKDNVTFKAKRGAYAALDIVQAGNLQ